MTYVSDAPDYLERARMHEHLASTTEDSQARAMHQAMAAEFRRRAQSVGEEPLSLRTQQPVMELTATIA
jgi:anti-sigma factor RsiW